MNSAAANQTGGAVGRPSGSPLSPLFDRAISLDDFAGYWQTTADRLDPETAPRLAAVDTAHRAAAKEDLEDYLDVFIQKLSKSTARRSPEENAAIFERGWAEHKLALTERCDFEALRPKYYQFAPPYCLGDDGEMYVCRDRTLPSEMQVLYMRHLARTHLRPFPVIHEFGSGSGLNLLAVAEAAPGKKIVGYDWTASGVELAGLIGRQRALDVSGRPFDMLAPNYSVDVRGQAVLTVTAIEQLNENYRPFLDYLLAQKPGLVVHLEPDTTQTATVYLRLAAYYMKMRGYPLHFTEHLGELADQGRISIVFSRRLPWLSSFCNFNCTIWKPL